MIEIKNNVFQYKNNAKRQLTVLVAENMLLFVALCLIDTHAKLK